MTKEEILTKHNLYPEKLKNVCIRDGKPGSNLDRSLSAMEEYAEQRSIVFAEQANNNYSRNIDTGKWESWSFRDDKKYTTKELYQLLFSPDNDGWVETKDIPLYTVDENGNWICTQAGNQPIIAALQYEDLEHPGRLLWWVMPCIVVDQLGLCVINDEENYPAGWDLADITHYKPLDLTPPKK